MTLESTNALYRYFETLYKLNQNLIILCGIDVLDNKGQYVKNIEEVIQSVPKLVPYVRIKNTNDYKIAPSDGLMEFEKEIPFLREDYERILQSHFVLLDKAKKIRNKLEHQMHGARIVASGSGSISLFDITYTVMGEKVSLEAQEIIDFVKEMNIMFAKIQDLADRFACANGYDDYPYYWRLIRFGFLEFNKIYESNLLRTVGKALLPF